MQPKSTARRKRMDVPFWERVNKNGPIPEHRPDLGPCWVWIAGTDSSGYGKITDSVTKRLVRSHHVSWSEANGPIPDGLKVLHHCDNPPCVRPEHLFVGTQAQNVADMFAKGRGNRQRGELRPDAKVTEDTVIAIRYRYDVLRARIVDLAKRYGLSKHHVHKIVHRQQWRYLP